MVQIKEIIFSPNKYETGAASPRKGPKGSGELISFFVKSLKGIITIKAKAEPIIKVMYVSSIPIIAPKPAKSFTSPKPIPSLFMTFEVITENKNKPPPHAAMPTSELNQPIPPSKKEIAKPTKMPPMVMVSGKSRYLKSMAKMGIRVTVSQNRAMLLARSAFCHGFGSAIRAATKPSSIPKNSTRGYFIEIGSLQFAQRPPKNSQPKMGTLCQIFIPRLQFGQCEAGRAMDIPRGILYISTLKKLPKHAPKTANKIHKKNAGIIGFPSKQIPCF